LPFIWQVVARPISHIIYGLLEAKPGDRVLDHRRRRRPAKWADDLRAITGPVRCVDVVEIIRDGRNAVMEKKRGRNGKLGCWQWTYGERCADASYDCIGILQSTQHCDDWRETGADLIRALKPGRRIVFAEAVLGGRSSCSASPPTCTWRSGTRRCFRIARLQPKSPTIRAKS
jgi:SAM-dependent methyltransferase